MDEAKMTALDTMVSEVDGNSPEAQAEAVQAQAAQVQAATEAQAWAVIPTAAGKLLALIAPELAEVYSDKACQDWGEAMVPVAQKYGWGGPGALPELNLAIATAGFAIPSWLIVRAKLAALREARELERKQAQALAGQAGPVPPPVEISGATGGS